MFNFFGIFEPAHNDLIKSSKSWRPISTGRLRKIPDKNTSWLEQRKGGYRYADKSVYLKRLLENDHGNKLFYITRRNQFGKTSFLQMAENFFNGTESLFSGLQIGNEGNAIFFDKRKDGGVPDVLKGQKWIQSPVIYLDFGKMNNFDNMSDFMLSHNQKL